MMHVATGLRVAALALVSLHVAGCGTPAEEPASFAVPSKIIDLGVPVTEDLPQQVWGKAALAASGFDRGNTFETINWTYRDAVNGSNSYYTIFNHGGPHIDAPNHIGLEGGLDSFPASSFVGPVRALDASDLDPGELIPREFFASAEIRPGDVVLVFTGYTPPQQDDQMPAVKTITPEAAKFLSEIPIRAFGTDSLSVHDGSLPVRAEVDDPVAAAVPIHHIFLSRGIPIYEQLSNVDRLFDIENGLFVGQPLEIVDGDGMIVRPFVLAE